MMKAWIFLLSLLAATGPSNAQPKPDFQQRSAATQAVAQAYFEAYVARDWDRLEPLVGEDARFEDPTASTLFGSTAKAGKAVLMKNFRIAFSPITAMSFAPTAATWASGEHAVFVGDLDWTIRLPDGLLVHTRMPLVTRIQVRDGKVIEHIDTADYRPFVTGLRAARAEQLKSAQGAAASAIR